MLPSFTPIVHLLSSLLDLSQKDSVILRYASQISLRQLKSYQKFLYENVTSDPHRYRSDLRLLSQNNQCTNSFRLQIKGGNVAIKPFLNGKLLAKNYNKTFNSFVKWISSSV